MKDSIKVLPIEHTSAIDKLIDYVPDLMEKANSIVDKSLENKDTCDKKSKIKIPSRIKNKKIKMSQPTTINDDEKVEEIDEYFGEEE